MNASARERFLRSVVEMEKRFGSSFHTEGPKAGRSFADHLVNVAFVSYELAILCFNQGLISEKDINIAFYAGLIHDTNKLLGGSLRQTANKEQIKDLLRELAPKDLDLFKDEDFKKIQFCVALHQDSGLQGMRLLIPPNDQTTELLIRIVKFADRFDNFARPDLSLEPQLKHSCEQVLKEMRDISEGKFPYTTLFYYLLTEYRGVLSEIIYEVADGVLKEKYEVVPIARFTNGVVYLADRGIRISAEDYEEILRSIRGKTLEYPAFSTNLVEAAAKFSSRGIRLANSAFDVSLDSLLSRLLILAAKKDEKYSKHVVFFDGIRKFFGALLENIPKGGDDVRKLKELFLSLTGVVFDDFPKGGKLEEMYREILAKASLQSNLEELKEKVKRELGPFVTKYGRGTLRDTLQKYLKDNFVCNGTGGGNSEQIVAQFDHYGSYKSTCSICGTSGEKMIKIQAQETPGMKVQMFTNRMKGHLQMEPRRMVCELCRLQMLATKGTKYRDGLFLIVMLPTNFYPQEFIDIIKDDFARTEPQKEEKEEEVFHPFYDMIFGRKAKKTSEVVTHNLAYVPYSHPGAKSWQESATIIAAISSALVTRFPVRILATSELLLMQEDIEFNDRILIKDAPPFVQRMLQHISLWAQIWNMSHESNVVEYLYELAKQPDYLSAAAVVVRRWDRIKPQKACVKLFKIFTEDNEVKGGGKVEELQKMADIASKWAYARADGDRKISDHQYLKPFEDATKAARQHNPKLGEDAEDLKALVVASVGRSLPEKGSWDEVKEFSDLFLSFLEKLGKNNLLNGKEVLIRDFAKYRNIFLGNIWLRRYERMTEKKKEDNVTKEDDKNVI